MTISKMKYIVCFILQSPHKILVDVLGQLQYFVFFNPYKEAVFPSFVPMNYFLLDQSRAWTGYEQIDTHQISAGFLC